MHDHAPSNGVNGSTGQYLALPMADGALREAPDKSILDPVTHREFAWWVERHGIDDPDRAPVRSVEVRDLSSTGWAVLFAPGIDGAVKEALQPLLSLRRRQATAVHEQYYREATFRPGQSKEDFLADRSAGFGPANPRKLPYYLLIVGDPTSIPFRFQYELDVQYAVGRIHFDRPEDYERYARSVVACEGGDRPQRRHVAFFGVGHDTATRAAVERLVRPLAGAIRARAPAWRQNLALADAAKKATLAQLLRGPEVPPALLFTSSHGLKYDPEDVRQRNTQGALLCQEWPGPSEERRPIDPAHYFCADDLGPDDDLAGLVAFHYACYSAGTPAFDDFSIRALSKPKRIAPQPFLSGLAKRFLHSGAAAVVGHVDRAWTYSFDPSGRGQAQTEVFENMLEALLDGEPVGAAMDYVNQRYAELSVRLSNLLLDQAELRRTSASQIARIKRASNDARNYLVVGDPAVRLPA